MAETVTMPKLGFDMAEGTLVRWVKDEGDKVNKGDVLAEIETDKATVEVESAFSGVMAKELVREGDIVPVGTAIAIIAEPGEKIDLAVDVEPETESPQVETGQKPLGDLNVSAMDSDKTAPAKIPSQVSPAHATHQPAKERDPETITPVDATLLAETVRTEEVSDDDGRLKASPLARKFASENRIDLHQVQGTGSGGRIVRSDVEAALQTSEQPGFIAPAPTSAAPAVPTLAPIGLPPIQQGAFQAPQDQSIKVNRLRTAIGRRMTASKQQVPHFYVTRAYKMEKVMNLRKQINIYLPDDQTLTVNDFVVKAVALTLRQFSNLNATIKGDEITRYGHVNIGIAVSIEGGLLTITVKDADQKPLRLISTEVREMAARVRAGKARTEDIEGSTFSISNLGMYDVDEFIAIINPPEAAILAIGSAKQVPVVEDGQVKAGLRMNATISADHRVTDGAEAARFMQALAGYLENPMQLVL
jgi:pyruvate dehydrogenase E2 component (dihydrolipoyllysine-residue acetyltransferase)